MLREPLFWIFVAGAAIGLGAILLLPETTAGPSGWEFAGVVQGGLLLLLVAFAGRGLLSEQGVGTAARNAFVWVGIIAMLLGGYAYRDELQDVGHRVSLGLMPGSAVTRLNSDGTAEVGVGRDRSGHFTVTAEVEGVPVRFLVDTGATSIALTATDAQRIGVDPGSLNYSLPIATANGSTTAAPLRIRSMTLGGIERRNLEAHVSRPGALGTSLLGMNFLGSLASFEIRGDRLILTD